jgi:hypothetical protein
MALKVAYFQPVVIAVDNAAPVEFSKIFNLTEKLHSHPELSVDTSTYTRGGEQIQVYPNTIELDVAWLITYLETLCKVYLDLVIRQSSTDELKFCQPVITNIRSVRQQEGNYQELHNEPGASISGNIYVSAPEFEDGSHTADGQAVFRMPHAKDIGKFIMQDTWKYTPVPGTVVVFPSYLPHTVYPWKGTGNLTVLSFDARLSVKESDNGQS